MCMICASVSGRKLTKQEFKSAWRTNADGFGYAYSKGGKTYFEKGFLKLKHAWRAYNEIPHGLPHVCHFRLGTHGSNCQELTHPFVCEWSEETPLAGYTDKPVLFHNGVYSDWKETLISLSVKHGHIPSGEMSDTRVIALLVGEVGVRALDYITGKFAIFSNGKLLIDGDWAKEENGIKFSSTTYSYSTSKYDACGEWWHNGFPNEYENKYGVVTKYEEDELEDLANLIDDSKQKVIEYKKTRWGG